MGLDQWADIKHAKKRLFKEIAYWRKHHDLHKWMENLFVAKGGTGEFNFLVLSIEDLDKLEKDVRGDNLPAYRGIVADDENSKRYKDDDLKFIETARQYVRKGYEVKYSYWW